jgi:hypothetical protein
MLLQGSGFGQIRAGRRATPSTDTISEADLFHFGPVLGMSQGFGTGRAGVPGFDLLFARTYHAAVREHPRFQALMKGKAEKS